MRILILGGDGMLGHQLYKHFSINHETKVTLRSKFQDYQHYGIFAPEKSYCNIDVRYPDQIENVFADFLPDAVINAVGIIKQRAAKDDILLNLEINAVLPHQLARFCKMVKAKLIHISTDCVFNGKKPAGLLYSESDSSDAEDIYGKTKFLGELNQPGALTLRTSVIGFELKNKMSLLEWALAQKGNTVQGYNQAIYTGFTTNELARVIELLLVSYPKAHGLYQVASEPITKFALLHLINQAFKLGLEIVQDNQYSCNRALQGERFNSAFKYTPPHWADMINELANSFKFLKSAGNKSFTNPLN